MNATPSTPPEGSTLRAAGDESTAAAMAARVGRLELLHRVGLSLSSERNRDRLLENILIEAKNLCRADGGTLYLRGDDDQLHFAIVRNDSLGLALGGTTGNPPTMPPIPLYFGGRAREPNLKNVATAAALKKKSFNISDAYDAAGFDFSGTKAFDKRSGYRSRSFLTIPLINTEDEVIGVLQLLNAADPTSGAPIAFSADDQSIVEALAAQAGIALDNKLLLDDQKELLESFIKTLATAIDAKSPYTGGHCERVPILTELIMSSLVEVKDGPFSGFTLTDDEWYELRIAAWLHDCGKVSTPVHVMDKATKLETIFDRIEIVRARFEVVRRDAEIECLRAMAAGVDEATARQALVKQLATLDEELAFLEKANIGGEFIPPADQERIAAIGRRRYRAASVAGEPGAPVARAVERPLLSDEEVANLSISRGTLTPSERIVINGHMAHTLAMLDALPFPRNLRRVPEYAVGHHEKMDGTGYPRGLYAGDMSIPARVMAIADVFEALTAGDRPYKKGKKLSEAMRIMGFMKRDNHLDPALFDHFVSSGVYRKYAERFLPPDLLDVVDETQLLAIAPKEFVLPEEESRHQRWKDLLPEYRPLIRAHRDAPRRGR